MAIVFRKLIPVVLLLLLLETAASQPSVSQPPASPRMWLIFRDRGSVATTLQSATPLSLGISQRALWRRLKVLPQNQLIDERDLPVAPEYIEAVRATGATIRTVSRWLNAVSVEAMPSQLQACAQLAFVQATQPVAVYKKRHPELSSVPILAAPSLSKDALLVSLDYGPSLTQLTNIKVVDVHSLGINGTGIIVGMVDDGYNNHHVHDAMKNIRVLAEYDFIQRDSNTSVAPNENDSQGNHGAYTLSALAGFASGKLIGSGYGASLLLAKTEVATSETQVEEDYYVEGLAWLESLGADVISSSLGYIDWYDFEDLDGRTAVTTKVARTLAAKGVLLVTAAGNEGHFRTSNPDSTGTLIAPADADSIVTVGAASPNGIIASFSSTGPTYDGRIKPEVVAQGVSVQAAVGSSTSSYIQVSGTSLSTPLTAGVAALILSARPELTPMQVREAMLQTTTRVNDGSRTATWPNNFYGWGQVNALNAVLYHAGPVFSNEPAVTLNSSNATVTLSIAAKVSAPLVTDSLFLYYRNSTSSAFQGVRLSATGQTNQYSASIPRGGGPLKGYFSARDNTGSMRTNPYNAPISLFSFTSDSVQTTPNPQPIPENFILYHNYPNPFNAGTIIRFEAPAAADVELAVYNILGQKVRTLYRGVSAPGVNQYAWNGARDDGSAVASGVYFARLSTPTATLTNAMVYTR